MFKNTQRLYDFVLIVIIIPAFISVIIGILLELLEKYKRRIK